VAKRTDVVKREDGRAVKQPGAARASAVERTQREANQARGRDPAQRPAAASGHARTALYQASPRAFAEAEVGRDLGRVPYCGVRSR
jgi:hypothetical protein